MAWSDATVFITVIVCITICSVVRMITNRP